MTKRRILYGYQIQNGAYAVRQCEADVIKQVFLIYQSGISYQGISDYLNKTGLPYSDTVPEWNKHKVKRLLENERYAGADGYPAIISPEDCQAVQTIQQAKKPSTSHFKQTEPSDWLWSHLYCEKCGGRLLRIGGPCRQTRIVYLECKSCRYRICVTRDELFREVIRQASTFANAVHFQYIPSEAVFHIENQINRCLEKPAETQTAVDVILAGISARYCACTLVQGADTVTDFPIEQLDKLAWRVSISDQNKVHVVFR